MREEQVAELIKRSTDEKPQAFSSRRNRIREALVQAELDATRIDKKDGEAHQVGSMPSSIISFGPSDQNKETME